MNDKNYVVDKHARLNEITKLVEGLGYKVWGVFLQGSQNYGLDTEKSDFDYKCFVYPRFSDLYSSKRVSETHSTKYGLVEVKDIRLLPELIRKGNPTYFELLFSTEMRVASHRKELLSLRDDLVKERLSVIVTGARGTIKTKIRSLFNRTERNKDEIERSGYEKKNFCDIVRLYYFIKDLLDGKSYSEAMMNEGDMREFLLNLKYTDVELDRVERMVSLYDGLADKLFQDNEIEQMKVDNQMLEKLNEMVMRICYMHILAEGSARYGDQRNEANTKMNVYQTHSHYSNLPARMKAYLRENHPDINEKHFVDILEYSEIELVNAWEIE